MSETVDADLYTRTKALLEPGDIELAGCIVHTTLGGQEDLEMHELTVAINEVIADHAGKGESYIEAGNDDTNFVEPVPRTDPRRRGFVWECQQLLRDGTFDLVFYYEANVDQEALADDLAELDNVDRVTQVP